MRVLAIETSTARGSIALVGAGGLIAEAQAPAPGAHLEWLAGAIADLLAAHDLTAAAIEGLAVSTGPGSFTGVRVGVVTAITWAEATGTPVVGVPTLEAIAAGVAEEGAAAPLLLAAVDVRRGEVAAALFALRGDARRLSPDVVARPADLPEMLSVPGALPVPDAVVLVAGDALERYGEALLTAAGPGARVAPRGQWWPRARAVGRLGRARLLAGARADPATVQPVYPRREVARIAGQQEPPAGGQNAGDGSGADWRPAPSPDP
ncbi:MAG: tRNA (adenosine(37)-N6)-threonylcarbamoyltransferase complex dimerization subunit type 1 TsaB [Armatimonadota bacterium]|nr:tRNA (adenosine(37)-N6)-threonylcarbamoyltransferase complex dimerization subunit type 1 TsaB [Armatimonadota bacterium]MDR7533582.1 tRNA (adenosine(37)-N6)-threonylcarbamoyltransferase complex dimerization subunit type 1 TsaB [Armatimonadota bacterium]MDR7537382.1 tRNA (adenosine(37)-N6)-threonylcarbamoyltransferase complex dimerization subunit type 1 TsaB [Armatimonadota bacterium]